MPPAAKNARLIALLATAVAYACLAHYTNTTANGHAGPLGTALALTPPTLAAILLAWHSRRRLAGFCLLALAGAAFWLAWGWLAPRLAAPPFNVPPFSVLYLVEHAGTEALLGFGFARTLRAGEVPMCSHFARLARGSLTPAIARYTRRLTLAWALFFGLMSATSVILFLCLPLADWSLFANFMTGPLICLMFVGEYAVRLRLHPDEEHSGIASAMKAYWNRPTMPPS
jgi:uncharacterized membrane protein